MGGSEAVRAVAEPRVHVRIAPTRGWRSLGLDELWASRELLYFLIWRELKGRYRQMALGPLWLVIAPLVFAGVMTVTLGRIARLGPEGLPYLVFVFSGQILWRAFASALANSANSLVANMRMISKVYFPRLVMPLSSAVSGLVDFAVCLVILGVLMACYGVVPGLRVLATPLFVLMALGTALGAGLWLACLSVKFRDVRYAVNYLLSIWLFASPVVYDTARLGLSARARLLYRLNPMTQALEGFRWSLLGVGGPPDLVTAGVAGFVVLLMLSGAYVFRRTERTIVDLL